MIRVFITMPEISSAADAIENLHTNLDYWDGEPGDEDLMVRLVGLLSDAVQYANKHNRYVCVVRLPADQPRIWDLWLFATDLEIDTCYEQADQTGYDLAISVRERLQAARALL